MVSKSRKARQALSISFDPCTYCLFCSSVLMRLMLEPLKVELHSDSQLPLA